MTSHQPVMLGEVIEGLDIKPDGIYIDATFGRGGHSREILTHLSSRGRLIALDRDPQAVEHAAAIEDTRFKIVASAFGQLLEVAKREAVIAQVDGILLDLGVSSPQLDDASRGFSFSKSGPLDMRMDPTQGESAAQWLMQAPCEKIAKVLREYGEERFAGRIASAIVKSREQEELSTTAQLAEIIAAAKPQWEKHIHPATKAFQAIRIFVNKELEELQAVLSQSLEVLAEGGRLVVISFHSLEDRIVKRFLRDNSRDQLPAKLPIRNELIKPPMKLIGKGHKASHDEIAQNPRARSATLRIGEKI